VNTNLELSKLARMDKVQTRRDNLRRWAEKNGVPAKERSYFSQLINGSSSFGEKSARRLEEEYGMGSMYLDSSDGAQAKAETKHIKVIEHDPEDPDFVEIRKVRLKLSAGIHGITIEQDEEDGNPITFRRDWLTKNGYFAEDLIAIKVRGDSMEPALYAGDTVVINTADKVTKDGYVYAVNYEGEDVVKRLMRDNGEWWLMSDNPDQRRYPRKLCRGGACIIIGRIVHKQSEHI